MEQAPKPSEAPKPKGKGMWIAVAAVIIIIVIVAGVYYAFYSAPKPDITIQDDSACAANATACKFDPTPFSASSGKTVLWKNNGNVGHTVYSCDSQNNPSTAACPSGSTSSVHFASSTLSNGGTFSFTFSSAGTYSYYCSIHLWMHGSVVIS